MVCFNVRTDSVIEYSEWLLSTKSHSVCSNKCNVLNFVHRSIYVYFINVYQNHFLPGYLLCQSQSTLDGLGGDLQWRHNWRDGVSNYQPHNCLLNRLFRRRSKETSKLRVTSLCAGNSPMTGEFPAQMASNAESVSIWWRHHGWFICQVITDTRVVDVLVLWFRNIQAYESAIKS